MTTNTPEQAPMPSAAPVTPTARWRFQRDKNGDLTLLIWTQPDTDKFTVQPLAFPMREQEGHDFVRGCDRVIALLLPAAHGSFTPVPDPDQVAGQLGVNRFLVTSPTVESHVAMVNATPAANWIEQAAHPGVIVSRVLVFAGDVGDFLDAAKAHGVMVGPGDA